MRTEAFDTRESFFHTKSFAEFVGTSRGSKSVQGGWFGGGGGGSGLKQADTRIAQLTAENKQLSDLAARRGQVQDLRCNPAFTAVFKCVLQQEPRCASLANVLAAEPSAAPPCQAAVSSPRNESGASISLHAAAGVGALEAIYRCISEALRACGSAARRCQRRG